MRLKGIMIEAGVITSAFGFTVHLGDGNYIKVSSEITLPVGFTEAEKEKAFSDWQRLFKEQTELVIKEVNNLKAKY